MATTTKPRSSKPVYNVRAKTGKDGDGRDLFTTIGAAWPFERGDGLNVRINLLPVGFDGHLMLVPPQED